MQKSKKEKYIKYIYITSAFLVVLNVALSFIYASQTRLSELRPDYIRDISIDIVAMLLCSALTFSLILDKPWDRHNRALFRLVFSLCFLFHFDEASSFMEGHAEFAAGVLMVNTLLLFQDTLLIYCFWIYVREELNINKKDIPVFNWICRGALITDAILDLLNCKYGFFFTVNDAGEYVAGPYEALTEITTFIIYLFIWYIIINAKGRTLREKLILLVFQVIPVVAHFASIATDDYSLVFPAYLFSVMLIYINVFTARSKRIVEQNYELDKQRAALMVSQIQPHFLYNVLTTISNLCVTDPEEAEETTVLFSQYLRTNLDSLRKTETVPFREELGHINTYLTLEKKRFKDKLNVEMDCPDVAFNVPALGLQPIVENSVKHGIRGKDSPGHLKISSRKVDNGHEVIIEDDGIGFDMNAPLPDDGRSHVGMKNVKSRLKQMCNARVTIVSSPGNGCKTTIFFPDEM